MVLTKMYADPCLLTNERLEDNRLLIRLMKKEEVTHYSFLVKKYVSPFYPETESYYAHLLADNFFGKSKTLNPNTQNRKIWAVEYRNSVIGYFTLTSKVGGSVKLAPCVLEPEFVGKGIGYEILEILEDIYQRNGYRKFYTTIPQINKTAISAVLKRGFSMEAVLKNHYSINYNEIVLGKIINKRPNSDPENKFVKANTTFSIKRGGAVKVEFGLDKFELNLNPLLTSHRRLYTFIDETDDNLIFYLTEKGFINEGSIIEQHRIGQNYNILSINNWKAW
jgi:GNAT superfamily N-acetyltransferase